VEHTLVVAASFHPVRFAFVEVLIAWKWWLAGKYTIFGQLLDGMEVLDKMEKIPTGKPSPQPIFPPHMPWAAGAWSAGGCPLVDTRSHCNLHCCSCRGPRSPAAGDPIKSGDDTCKPLRPVARPEGRIVFHNGYRLPVCGNSHIVGPYMAHFRLCC
jgi:Cyclophilin type peptidyl-prolyl cis-trans isomerase/CLD